MTYSQTENELAVYIGGARAGMVWRDKQDKYWFQYSDGYLGPDISVSMPFNGNSDTYGDESVRPWLFGLLPDNTRKICARRLASCRTRSIPPMEVRTPTRCSEA